jgi:sarcosine oxidase subunit beta
MFPNLPNLRLMRHWSGTADIPMDGNAIVGKTEIEGLYVNCGWGYAGFKATPAVGWKLAELLSANQSPEMLKPFALSRFFDGRLIDDSGIGPYPWRH